MARLLLPLIASEGPDLITDINNKLAQISDELNLKADITTVETGTVQNKSGDYTALTTDDVIYCSVLMTVRLYTAVGNSGNRITIKKTGAGQVTVQPSGSETIDGDLKKILRGEYTAIKIQSDGTNWLII